MPAIETYNEEALHSDDMQDIITTVPPWILRWGITLFFGVLVLMIGLSALIRYPDIIKTSLKIDSPNAPKPIVSKIPGKLVKLLVTENSMVDERTALAYLESTADHQSVLTMLEALKQLQQNLAKGQSLAASRMLTADNLRLGELQQAYQVFYQEYLTYRSSVESGLFIKKKAYLQKDLADLNKQETELNAGKTIQQRNLKLASDEYEMHQKLAKDKVETSAELRQQEAKYLSQKSPLIQTESALITASNNYSAKQKEILELNNQILEEQSKFSQALNSLISQGEDWKNKYVLSASQAGKLSYAGIVQENQVLQAGQEVFYINPGNEKFFGEMPIPQLSMGKVKEGQQVLIKLKSYPFEEYGMIRGYIRNIADVPYKDSVFIAEVSFKKNNATDQRRPIHLKPGMTADAEIITQDATMLQRLYRSIYKVVGDK